MNKWAGAAEMVRVQFPVSRKKKTCTLNNKIIQCFTPYFFKIRVIWPSRYFNLAMGLMIMCVNLANTIGYINPFKEDSILLAWSCDCTTITHTCRYANPFSKPTKTNRRSNLLNFLSFPYQYKIILLKFINSFNRTCWLLLNI